MDARRLDRERDVRHFWDPRQTGRRIGIGICSITLEAGASSEET
jgi:hypothetical protein